jgi:putative oxidoreductase
MTIPAAARDIAILLARVAVGAMFVEQGLQKLATVGIPAVAGSFEHAGVPFPVVAAWFAATVETVGGVALIAGAAVPVVGLLLVADMVGVLFFVHIANGMYVENNGYEFVLTLGAAALLLVAVGPGRYSVDGALTAWRAWRGRLAVAG